MVDGVGWQDHHFKDKTGKYQASPPKELTKLYAQGPPTKLSLTASINSLKAQTHCLGVYTLLEGKATKGESGQPMWKHATEDLVIAAAKLSSGEDGWVVAHFTTFGVKQQVCMRVMTNPGEFPFKGAAWTEWDGHTWMPAPSTKCRPSWHGWGMEKLDRSRLKFSPASPDGAY